MGTPAARQVSAVRLCAGCFGPRFAADPRHAAAPASAECLDASLCCTFCPGCGPGVQGMVDMLLLGGALAGPPGHLALELSGERLTRWEEYDTQVKAEVKPPRFSEKFRAIDGQGNLQKYPWLGQGGRPFGLMCPARRSSTGDLPDARALVTELFNRQKFEAAPNGTNSLVYFLTVLVHHDLFRAGTGDVVSGVTEHAHVNLHSSYLDLQVVYGYNRTSADVVREFEDGRLKTDAYADARLDALPVPRALCILLVREHNFICEQLAEKYPDDHADEAAFDEALYQQARMILQGVFVSIIARDLAGGITGVYRRKGEALTVVSEARGPFKSRAAGVHSCWEFNFLYRLAAARPACMTAEYMSKASDRPVEELLTEAMAEPSGRFGASHWPLHEAPGEDLVEQEVAVIELARSLGVGTLNDFRQIVGLKPVKKFTDLTDDESVLETLKRHYETVDRIEFYVGLNAEKIKIAPEEDICCNTRGTVSQENGWGLPPTMEAALLPDIMTRIANDRFHSTDFGPDVYTEWGYQHASETTLVDLINRHTSLKLPKNTEIGRTPEYAAPTSLIEGWSTLLPGRSKVAPAQQAMSR